MTATKDALLPAGPPPPAAARVGLVKRVWSRGQLTPYLLLLPALAAVLVLLGWPTVQMLGISLRKLDLRELVTGKAIWVGLQNYTDALTDPEFWTVTVRTVVFTAALVATTLLIALLIAVLMRHLNPVVRIVVQISLVLAWAVPVISTTTVFQWIFDQQYGILNKTLDKLGFHSFIGYSWFASGTSTLVVIGLLVLWQAVPFVAFTLYAGLLGVPREQYEAAGIDGAGPWQTFRAVTWPVIRPILTMVTFLSLLWDFTMFAQVWAIRQGGPDGASTTLAILQYLKGIAGSHFGSAAAIATIMLVLLLAVTARYVQLLVRSKDGELA
ncbi:carbohydrate ABC transporter membrane protein 1 (CUT1 family) [Amycolatopsis sulphurea]|uniref:Carbohydrate ABC transporter membrane protein 1 (CUT1 family) n=1 Tax=Amycolatopsis sulphurea TaxID=76022 RepID=A0A2A9G2E9_9PSEU|nr:sugar ABC transporter permease [Amycolatopsis sulphurea]PFG57598.1 carbohydrate ABC transporter membrane protein 1 (CUT1 family) [Amycolatopsis sulphurea]